MSQDWSGLVDIPSFSGDAYVTLKEWDDLPNYFSGAQQGDAAGFPSSWIMGAWVVESAPDPETSTMLLFGTGLIGLAGWGRRKFKKNQ